MTNQNLKLKNVVDFGLDDSGTILSAFFTPAPVL